MPRSIANVVISDMSENFKQSNLSAFGCLNPIRSCCAKSSKNSPSRLSLTRPVTKDECPTRILMGNSAMSLFENPLAYRLPRADFPAVSHVRRYSRRDC